jgi:enoyl-CoA hydratase/carnithine racemase
MHDGPVSLFTDNNIAFCELASPPGNIMNTLFFDHFCRIAGSFPGLAVDGMVICSSGRHFSSGADVNELMKIINQSPCASALDLVAKNHAAFELLAGLHFPVVAAITGCCLGAALELALACRFRICTKNAVFALPESTFGLMPGCGGTIRLPALIGVSKAMELVLTGQTFGPKEALESGLVDLIVEKKTLVSTSLRLIEKTKVNGMKVRACS